ncbi:MAG: mannose-1-phosphate guanylyltransferase/mannose-6-phosphate isomerase [Wolinella sp.]
MRVVVLCGGSGTRLWPLSRTLMPKQFVKLLPNRSLFQETLARNREICDSLMVVTNEEQYFLAQDEAQEAGIAVDSYLLESVAKNTAPAIALAALALNPSEIMLVVPSDHLIPDTKGYHKSVKEALGLAAQDYLVTFGIAPKSPETGYGYIEAEGTEVKAFHEKPDLARAQEYLKGGRHFWNSGMFCFKAGIFLKELQKHAPDILESVKRAFECSKEEGSMRRIPRKEMELVREESIDYALMERSHLVKMVRADFAWNDVGSFDSLAEEIGSDEHGNFILADKEVALLGIERLIVVDTPDALLVAKKGTSQQVKEVVARLKREKPELVHVHRSVHRPWGSYTVLEEAQGYKIKRIVVKPHGRLSLQKHHHRNEHWIVVSGIAHVTIGERSFLLRPNESTYIKMGEVHRLENRGKIPLVLIEAQVGEYLGEDDIIRIEDDYKRERG